MRQVGKHDDRGAASDELAQQTCEARYRTLFDYAQVGILLADAGSVYLDANACICQMLGYSREELVGKHASDIVAPAEISHIDEALGEIHGRSDHRREWRFRRKDGTTFPADVVATTMPDGTLLGLIRDLSDRQRIHEYSEHVAAIVESSPDAIIGKDLQGTITAWNAGAEALFGYTAAEMVGAQLARLIPEDRLAEEQAIMERLRRGERIEQLETRRLTRDGRLLDVSLTAAPMRDAGGHVSGASVVARDITSLKRHERQATHTRDEAERILRDQQQFTDTMIESMPGVVYFYDATGHFLRWNRNFETVTGYSGADIARMHPRDFFPVAVHAELEQRIAEVFARGESSLEAPFQARDGSTTPYYFTGRRVDFAGGPCLVGVGIDLSERRLAEDRLTESERQYRELVEHANSIILRWNSEGCITFMNAYGLRFFGYAPPEILGRHVMETLVPPTESGGRDLRRLMDDICADPAAFEQNINENMRSNGDRVWVAWTNRIVRDAQGRVQEILSIGTDITERRQIEERLRQSQKLEAFGQLAGGVAHDFNNLLTVISGYSSILLAKLPPSDPMRRQVMAIADAGERATTLTRQLLAFSRKSVLDLQVLDLNATVGETEAMLRRLIGEDIILTTVLRTGLSPVRADAGQLGQALMNLVVNARDAMPRGGRLTIETAMAVIDADYAASHIETRAGTYIRLAVSDTGPGIAPEARARLFEPFFTTKPVGKGTGLGLAVVHGMVKQCGGFIEVYSEAGLGTTFKLYLPAAVEPAGLARPALAPAPAPSGTETILLVEDEDDVRRLATLALEQYGYTVLAVANGSEALALAERQQGRFALLLTDVVMPGMGGGELSGIIRSRFPHTKVLFMSGYTDDAVVRHGILQEQVAFLHKPFTPGDLARRVRSVLDG